MELDLREIGGDRLFIYLMLVAALTVPGVSYQYYYHQSFFEQTDLWKLLILGSGISLVPLILATAFIQIWFPITHWVRMKREEWEIRMLGLGAYFTLTAFFFAVIFVHTIAVDLDNPSGFLWSYYVIGAITLLVLRFIAAIVKRDVTAKKINRS